MPSARPLSFVLAASDQGTLIVNHLDRHVVSPTAAYGVGHQILQGASFDPSEVALAIMLLKWLRETRGDGVIALDCGANVGVHTISWAREMTQWGKVIAFEAQERIFYALAGNICLNNCFNARAIHAAVGDQDGVLSVPAPNYNRPGSFGSLELIFREGAENIGQTIDYTALEPVRALRLDDLALPRVDFLKIDVEGMELPVTAGRAGTGVKTPPIPVDRTHQDQQGGARRDVGCLRISDLDKRHQHHRSAGRRSVR